MSQRARDWLEDRLDILVVHGDEVRLRNCLFCDRARTMKVNVEKRRFICFSCQESGGFVKLVMAVEECDKDRARDVIRDMARGISRARYSFDDLEDAVAALETEDEEEEEESSRIVHPLPDEFIPCWSPKRRRFRIPTYLKDRDVTRDMIRRWGIGYCDHGTYGGRVVIPVKCDGSRSFVARSVDGDGPKYLTPDGWDDSLLFGYDDITPGATRVVAMEGVFDVMRVRSYGHESVGYFGQQLGKRQIDLLVRRGVYELTLMPDGNDPRAVPRALRDAAILDARFPVVTVARLEGDPDESSQEECDDALTNARPVSGKGDAIRERLSTLKQSW